MNNKNGVFISIKIVSVRVAAFRHKKHNAQYFF